MVRPSSADSPQSSSRIGRPFFKPCSHQAFCTAGTRVMRTLHGRNVAGDVHMCLLFDMHVRAVKTNTWNATSRPSRLWSQQRCLALTFDWNQDLGAALSTKRDVWLHGHASQVSAGRLIVGVCLQMQCCCYNNTGNPFANPNAVAGCCCGPPPNCCPVTGGLALCRGKGQYCFVVVVVCSMVMAFVLCVLVLGWWTHRCSTGISHPSC